MEIRFLADCMLGRLAKWLRVLGYDVAYDRRVDDEALIARAAREGRTLLTRDVPLSRRRILRRAGCEVILIASDKVEDQIAQMVEERGLVIDPGRLLSRCLVCNEPTSRVPKESVAGMVPAYVYQTQERFSRCGVCGRVYWRATHADDI